MYERAIRVLERDLAAADRSLKSYQRTRDEKASELRGLDDLVSHYKADVDQIEAALAVLLAPPVHRIQWKFPANLGDGLVSNGDGPLRDPPFCDLCHRPWAPGHACPDSFEQARRTFETERRDRTAGEDSQEL